MCLSCALFQPMSDVAESFALTTFNRLAPGSLLLFNLFIGFWLLSFIMKLLKGKFVLSEFLVPALIFTFIDGALLSHQFFWEYVYTPLQETTLGLISLIVQTSQGGKPVKDLAGLLQTVEQSMMVIFHFGERVYSSGGWTSIIPALLGVFLLVPFLILWAYFLLYTIEYIFVFLVVSSLSPLMIMAAGFEITRTYTLAALKVVLQSILTVVISIIAMGLTLKSINEAAHVMHLSNADSSVVNDFGNASAKFVSLFALGLVSIFFQRKAPQLAASLIGSEGAPSHAVGMVSSGILAANGFLNQQKEKIRDYQSQRREYANIQNKLRGTDSGGS